MFASSSFIPVMTGQFRRTDGYDRFGTAAYTDWESVGLSVVKLDLTMQPTSIRTDKSGSKSRAEEDHLIGRVLADKDIPHGSILKFAGREFRVVGVFPRYDMDARINHWQIDFTPWREN